eukprot:1384016-Rhodomonas_salina.2
MGLAPRHFGSEGIYGNKCRTRDAITMICGFQRDCMTRMRTMSLISEAAPACIRAFAMSRTLGLYAFTAKHSAVDPSYTVATGSVPFNNQIASEEHSRGPSLGGICARVSKSRLTSHCSLILHRPAFVSAAITLIALSSVLSAANMSAVFPACHHATRQGPESLSQPGHK